MDGCMPRHGDGWHGEPVCLVYSFAIKVNNNRTLSSRYVETPATTWVHKASYYDEYHYQENYTLAMFLNLVQRSTKFETQVYI